MDWLKILGDLSPAALLVVALWVVAKFVVGPFRTLMGNHIEHLMAEQQADRNERAKMREALEKQTAVIDKQSEGFDRLCDRLDRG